MCNRGAITVLALSFFGATTFSCGSLRPDDGAAGDTIFPSQHLTAILQLPQRYDSSKAYPLLVALHGNGDTAGGFAPTFSSFSKEQILVAVPQGEYPKSFGGYSWFFETSDRSLWELYDTRSVEHVVGLISEIGARHRTGKIFVLGFSQGASLAYMVGLRNPSVVTGVLALSGRMPEVDLEGSIVHAEHIEAARDVKMFIARGTSDAAVGRQVFTTQRDFFLSRGYSVTSFEYAGGHYLTPELLSAVREWLELHSGG